MNTLKRFIIDMIALLIVAFIAALSSALVAPTAEIWVVLSSIIVILASYYLGYKAGEDSDGYF